MGHVRVQDGPKHDPVHMAGAGYIDIFTTDGVFATRFATGGNLNAPWGMVLRHRASVRWAATSGLEISATANIHAFNDGDGRGQPKENKGKPLQRRWTVGAGLRQRHQQCVEDLALFHRGPEDGKRGIFGKFEVMSQKIFGSWRRHAEADRRRTLRPVPGMM